MDCSDLSGYPLHPLDVRFGSVGLLSWCIDQNIIAFNLEAVEYLPLGIVGYDKAAEMGCACVIKRACDRYFGIHCSVDPKVDRSQIVNTHA